jgi:SNF2 family DNA or RNA helicase
MELRPFQQEFVDKMGDRRITGVLNGDDMGLGKTIENLARDQKLRAAHGFPEQAMTLIVAPRGTHEKPWAWTVKEYLGKKAIVIDRKNRGPFLNAVKHKKAQYYICHYEALRLMPELKQVVWFHIIADECHRIKNWKAQQSRALKSLRTQYKTAASGTPADDKPQDIWSTLNWLYRGKFSSYWTFVNRVCQVVEETGRQGKKYKKIVDVNTSALPEFYRAIAPFYMRRLKEDVLKDLPEKFYTQRLVDLLPGQRRIYLDLREEMLAWIGEHEDEPLDTPTVVSQIVRLQQAALGTLIWIDTPQGKKVKIVEPSAKVNELLDILDDSVGPWVVFSKSKSAIKMTCERLTKEGLRVAEFTGDTPDAKRDPLKDGFQEGKYDVFAATMATGGEGIQLTRSSTVIFLDREWSPRPNKQAEDRLHRMGQTNAVQVIDIQARNTVDQRVQDTNLRKMVGIRAVTPTTTFLRALIQDKP